MAIVLIILLVLNSYPLFVSQNLIFQSKASTLQGSAYSVMIQLAGVDSLNEETVHEALAPIDLSAITRVLVTDADATVVFDTGNTGDTLGKAALYTEVIQALQGQDAFYCGYRQKAFHSRAATPVVIRGKVIGAVFLYDYDNEQGTILANLQRTLATISLAVGLAVVALAFFLSERMASSAETVLESMESFRDGDYSARASVHSKDEIGQIGQGFNEMAEQLQVADKARRQFVSDASHELKTPLAAICLLSDSIIQDDNMDKETMVDFVGDIGMEAERLRRITEKLLQISRLETPENQEKPHRINVEPALLRTMRTLQVLAEEKNVDLTWEIREPCYILDTEDTLQQVIFNLAENAIKYNREGGFVHVSAFRELNQVLIRVEDDGVGIPEEDKPHIFDRFYRVDKSRTVKGGGTGLGLAIVAETVQSRGGTVDVKDRDGGGTVFTVHYLAVKGEDE